MSRSKLSNSELKFITTDGNTETIFAKLKSTTNGFIFEGASGATRCRLQNIADPTSSGDAVTFDYLNSKLDSLNNGLSWKEPVKAKSTVNIPATRVGSILTFSTNGQLTMDGIVINLFDRVLLANQTDQVQNGIYACTDEGSIGDRDGIDRPAQFTRADDADTSAKLKTSAVFIERGNTQSDTGYVMATDDIVVNTSNLEFVQFSSVGEILAGDGLSKSGNTIKADVDNVTLEISAGNLSIKGNSVGASQMTDNSVSNQQIVAQTITDAEMATDAVNSRVLLNSSVINTKLATSSVSTDKVQEGAINADKLGVASVETLKIKDLNVTRAKLETDCIDSTKIEDNAVGGEHILAGAILSTHIYQSEVKEINIATDAVTSNKIKTRNVTSSKIALVNVLEEHIADNQITTLKIASNQINEAHLKTNSVSSIKIVDGSITSDKIANNSITTSKIGILSGLTVNGIVNATSFVASGSGGEADGGFALPKAKSVNINFTTNQTIPGDDIYVTMGTESSLSAVNFAYDDAITMAVAISAFRINHYGATNDNVSIINEVSYYNSAGVAQAYANTGRADTYNMYHATATDSQLGNQSLIGDGSSHIAGIRLRIKHDIPGNTLYIKDTLQLTALCVDDSSGAVTRTFSSGTIS